MRRLDAYKHAALAKQEVADALDDWSGTKPKTAPHIADAVIERMKNRQGETRVFDRKQLRQFINTKKLNKDTTPSSYKFDGRSGADLAALPAEQLTYEITDPTTGNVIGFGSVYDGYQDPLSHPKGLRLSSNRFVIDTEIETQDTLEKCRELAYRDALAMLSMRTKRGGALAHEELIKEIDDAERKKAVKNGAEALKKQTEYTRNYTGLFNKLAPGVSCIVTPAEGRPYVYITTENKHFGKRYYDLSDEGIKKAAKFALEHSTELQSRARSAARGGAIDSGTSTEREESGVSYEPPPDCDNVLEWLAQQRESIDGGAGMDTSRDDATSGTTERPRRERDMRPAPSRVAIDIDDPMDDDEQGSPASHAAVDFDEEDVAPAPAPARTMAPPAPLPRADPEDRGAAARAAKRARATAIDLKGVVVVCGDVTLVRRDRYNAVAAEYERLRRELEELRRRVASIDCIDYGGAAGGADRYKLREPDRDRQAWDKVRGIVIRLNTPLDRPTGRSLQLIQAEGRAHTSFLSLLFGERVEVRFDRCPVDPFERCGASWAARLACNHVYWDARGRMSRSPADWDGYVVLRDNVKRDRTRVGTFAGLGGAPHREDATGLPRVRQVRRLVRPGLPRLRARGCAGRPGAAAARLPLHVGEDGRDRRDRALLRRQRHRRRVGGHRRAGVGGATGSARRARGVGERLLS